MTMTVKTGTEEKPTTEVERLLGVYIHQNLKWDQMILMHEKSLLKALQTRTNELNMITKIADFRTRKMIADGIFNSKLCYCLTLFGGTEDYLLRAAEQSFSTGVQEG